MAGKAASGKHQVWLDRLRRYKRSELTVAEFCADEGVSVPSFYHWKRKLAGARSPAVPRSQEASAFQQLHVTLAANTPAMVIRLPSGVVVEVAEHSIDAVIGRLLAVES